MRATGQVDLIYAPGTEAVLRVPSGDHLDGIPDARTESVAVPAVRAAGIRAPALLAVDQSLDLVDVPSTIYERVSGCDWGSRPLDGPEAQHRVCRQLGREVAILDREVSYVRDPHGWLDGQAPADDC